MSSLRYRYFDASSAEFPRPRVPLLPGATADSWAVGRARKFELIDAGRSRLTYRRGRYALHEAYRLCGAGAGTAMLAPAYHCRTMLDPAIRLGANVLLYPSDEALVPRADSLSELIKLSPRPVRAMLLTHYFGMPQDVQRWRMFCDLHGIALIEDCSHALFNASHNRTLGRLGCYAVASPYKFLPCDEGGWLMARQDACQLPPPPRPAPFRDEARVLVHVALGAWERMQHGRRKRSLADNGMAVESAGGEIKPAGRIYEAESDAVSTLYDPNEEGRAASRSSTALARMSDADRVAETRRKHYKLWLQASPGFSRGRPLFGELPDDCVPYMFPLLIDRPGLDFGRLKRRGLPIWRWDEMALSNCQVAARYSHHLLHLPCHQALDECEMTWMVQTVASVLSAAS